MNTGLRQMVFTAVMLTAGLACAVVALSLSTAVDTQSDNAASFNSKNFIITGYSVSPDAVSSQGDTERNVFDYKGNITANPAAVAVQASVFDGLFLEGLIKVGDTPIAFIKSHGQRKVVKLGEEVTSGVVIKELTTDFVILAHSAKGETRRFYVNN